MLHVKKGNKQYRIEDHQKEQYKSNGFDIIDKKGKVVERGNLATPKRLKELEAENAQLKEEIAKLKKAAKEAKSK